MGIPLRRVVAVVVLAISAVGCGDTPGGTVTVLAAASLTEAMTEIAEAFDGVTRTEVELSFGPSSGLVAQIQQGAPADVFASADGVNMDKLVASGDVAGAPRPFARNRLTLAVPAGNPNGVTGLADLARGDLIVGLCAPPVPCGRLAREAAAKSGVTPVVDTEEPDVRSLLTKLEAGEVDVGIVYATDVRASERVEAVAIPDPHNVVTTYPIATLRRSDDRQKAADFIAFVTGQGGQILAERGFEPIGLG